MLRRSVLMSGLVLVLIVSLASAQQRRGQGRRGFGGRGFGAMRASSAMLLGIEEVQKELGLSDEQKKQVDELLSDVREQMRSSFGGFQEMQDLSQEEREERFAEMRKKAAATNKQADEKVGSILDTKQAERLGQLRIQREGLRALSRPEIAERLGLTEEQQTQMRKIREDARPQARGGRDMSEEDRRAMFARMRQQREKMEADILAVLTDEQKQKWAEAKGQAFEFPRPQGFGGSGGRNAGPRRRPPSKKRDQ